MCSSSERERAQTLLLERRILPLLKRQEPLRILHVAPEAGIRCLLQALPRASYLSGDFEPGRAMIQLDLRQIEFPDASFDLIFVSHVLEHVDDDRRALAELYRVLDDSGALFVDVPVLAEKTYESPAATTKEDRLREFGQVDHVRLCGLDYENRLVEAGFHVTPLRVDEEFSPSEIAEMRLCVDVPEGFLRQMPKAYEREHEISWLCQKPRRVDQS